MLDSHLIAHTRPKVRPENVVMFGDIRVSVLADRLFRIEMDETHQFCDDATEAVWFRDMPPVSFTTDHKDAEVEIKTEKVTLVIKKNFVRSYVLIDGEKRPLTNEGNLLGTYTTLDGCDGDEYIDSQTKERTKIKLAKGVVSRSGIAVLDYTHSSVLKQDGMITKQRNDSLDIYVFAYGKDYRAAVQAYYMICGNTPLIPRFAFGNWWSRYYAYTEEEYLNILDRMEERDVPLTVATVDMDWHWNTQNLSQKPGIEAKMPLTERTDKVYGGTSGWTGYSWNTNLFPDYKRFLKTLHERNLHTTLNLHPATGVRFFEDMYEEMAKAMGVDPETEHCVRLDFTSDQFINNYFKILHKPYEQDGVDFWWIDWQQGPRAKAAGIDIMWVLNHYHTMDNAKGHMPMILSRYSGLGAHRYPLGFSGDTYITWKTLAYLPYFTANASNIGFTWWSHDIGGHQNGIKDDELYVRSVQFGVFSPINRLHCTSTPFMTKEAGYYMNGTGHIAEEFMRLRHKMIPFLYSASVETTEKGLALMEPMYYEYPDEEKAYEYTSQYMFGGQLLVAPVITKGDAKGLAKTKVWLPEGTWTDIFTGNVYEGARETDMVRYMDTIPVLAKEGGFFVLDGRKHTNSVELPDQLTVLAFNGNGAYTLHEDSDAGRMNTEFVSSFADGKQTVTLKADGAVCVPERLIRLELRNIHRGTVCVYADGQPVEAKVKTDGFVIVTIPKAQYGVTYTVEVTPVADKKAERQRFFDALTRLEVIHSEKYGLLNAYREGKDAVIERINNSIRLTDNEKLYMGENV